MFAVWMGGCTELPQNGSLGEELDALVQKELKGGSLVAAAFVDGEIVRFAGYGEISEGGPPPDEDSLYRVGSLSKSLTALTVMSLVEDGLIDLDGPLTEALPSFATGSAPSRPITMRDLLTHQSGLVSDRFVRMIGTDAPSIEETTAGLAEEELAAEPGEMWSYSNVGFNVAGHAAQEAAGVPFADLVGERIFAPCGMETATWDFGAAVQGFDGSAPADEGSAISTVPAGAAVLSIRDLAAYAGALTGGGACAGGAIVEPTTLEEMWTKQPVAEISGDPLQGIGFFVDPTGSSTGGYALAAHPGDTVLFHTNFVVVPELGLGVAVSASERDAAELVWELGIALLQEEIEARTGQTLTEPQLPAPADDPDEDVLSDLEGVYTTDLGILDLRQRGGGLNTGGLRLLPTEEGTYRLRPRVLGIRLPFLIDGVEVRFATLDGRDVIQASQNGAFQTVGERVPAPADTFGWEHLAGTWSAIDDLHGVSLSLVSARLAVDADGYLPLTVELDQLGQRIDVDLLLRPLDPERARVEGIGRYRGGIVTAHDEVLTVLGARFARD